MSDRRPTGSLYSAIGDTNLARWGGILSPDSVTRLKGRRWHEVAKEMDEGDPVVRAMLFAVEMLIRRTEWHVDPADDSAEAADAAAFVDDCRHDMEATWEDTLAAILSFLPYGWSFLEVVYKQRLGDDPDPARRSAFDDGKIGWRRWSLRPQDSLWKWVFDDAGTPVALVQQTWRGQVTIPLDRGLLFRAGAYGESPEGRSVLRSAYDPWTKKQTIQWLEEVRIEREGAGIPVLYIPAQLMQSTDPDAVRAYDAYKHLVRNVRTNDQQGIVLPSTRDDKGNPAYELKLLTGGGQTQVDTDKVVARHNQAIAQVILADFILLGHENVGSYALATSKTRIFATAIEAWLDMIANVVNEQGIKRLLRLNGTPLALAPRLAPGDVEGVDAAEFSGMLKTLADAGILDATDADLRRYVLETLGLPTPADPDPTDVGESDVAPPATPPTDAAAAATAQAATGAAGTAATGGQRGTHAQGGTA